MNIECGQSKTMSISASKNYDLAVIGGGVVGLWCAYLGAKAGLKIALFEANTIASGASGGLLGALMPHMPTQWYEKKQFQFEALIDLEPFAQQLEAESGIDCGYARVGRILPLSLPEHEIEAQQKCDAAAIQWARPNRNYEMRTVKKPTHPNWPHEDVMPHGATIDNFSARINPRGVTSALLRCISDKVDILENSPVELQADKSLKMPDGGHIIARDIIVTAGLNSFDLLQPFVPSLSGRPIKGQAAMLDTKLDPQLPVVHQAGVYLIVHNDGRTAVGSTSEREFEDGHTTDHLLEEVIEKARRICPLVGNAPVVERWASLRMQPYGRDPLVGPVPEHEGLHICTGGFKITFGIAHRMAAAVLAPIIGNPALEMPPSFQVENRVNHIFPRT